MWCSKVEHCKYKHKFINCKIFLDMGKLTEQQQAELDERNAAIAQRFTTLSEAQPLATANKIILCLAKEYNLAPQHIGRILRERGIETVTQPYTNAL